MSKDYVTLRKARLNTQLTNVQAALTNLYTALTDTSSSSVHSYQFDSGEGIQKTTRRKLEDIQKQIDALEAKERHLINELSNMGIISIKSRRNVSNGVY